MSQLNPQQQQAVQLIDHPLLVLAGAGSGKTRVISQKILYLINRCQYKPSSIYAVTFTNKAAREMHARLSKQLPQDGDDKVVVSTFHTLGLKILYQEYKHCGLKRNFTIFDAQDCLDLLRQLIDKKNLDKQYLFSLQNKISMWKNALLTPEQAMQNSQYQADKLMAKVYEQYQIYLRAYNAVDFDDLIALPNIIFQKDQPTLEKWRMKIRYLLVDEYQDTNSSQYMLVKYLVGGRSGLTVVGDDDQSIYAWRGAQPENLSLLQKDFPSLKMIKLEQNYRSSQCILQAANHVIANNAHMFDKRLWSDIAFGEKIRIIACDDEKHEAEEVITQMRSHQLLTKAQYGDYAILYRSNHQSRILEKALRHHDLPYKISGGLSFFSRTEIKDIFAYCRLLANLDDDAAFLRVINTPRRGIGLQSLQKIGTYAQSRHSSLFQAAGEIGLAQHLAPAVYEKVQKFTRWFSEMKQQCDSSHPMPVLRNMIKKIDYHGWLLSNHEKKSDADDRMLNIEELLNWFDDSFKHEKTNTLSDLINRFALLDSPDKNEQESNAIQLMTMHAAKGLEFPNVFIVGMEEDICPHRNSIEEDNIEEERRLAYVGITRAERQLYFTFTKERQIHGKTKYCEPSRFLQELPEDTVIWQGDQRKVEDTKPEQTAKNHLSALRELLD